MKLFAISDLHLSFRTLPDTETWTAQEYKPMSEMDSIWGGHARKIFDNWKRVVTPSDIVFVAGDISWAMKLEEALTDLGFLAMLPGTVIAVQGNHDYWWQSISKTRSVLPPNVQLIQNDCVVLGDVAVCGSRGWICPNGSFYRESDEKIYRRELIRMENSLKSAPAGVRHKLVLMHYMPTNEKHQHSGFVELFKKYGVGAVVYGHLHARACKYRLPYSKWGINFYLTSADYLGFAPLLIGYEDDGKSGLTFFSPPQSGCPDTSTESL